MTLRGYAIHCLKGTFRASVPVSHPRLLIVVGGVLGAAGLWSMVL